MRNGGAEDEREGKGREGEVERLETRNRGALLQMRSEGENYVVVWKGRRGWKGVIQAKERKR